MDQVELRARIRAAARDPESFAARAGLQPELVRQVLTGHITPAPWLQERLAATLLEPEGEP